MTDHTATPLPPAALVAELGIQRQWRALASAVPAEQRAPEVGLFQLLNQSLLGPTKHAF
jgi:hypothetical protein